MSTEPEGCPSARGDLPGAPLARLGVGWMDHAACASKTYLPWTADPHEVSDFQKRAMRAVCGTCPVVEWCQDYASARRVDTGFWAGRPRGEQPAPVVVPLVLQRPETFEERAARVNALKQARRVARLGYGS